MASDLPLGGPEDVFPHWPGFPGYPWNPPPPQRTFDVVISDSSLPRIPTYAQVQPCLDQQGHNFKMQYPEYGEAGNPVVVCSRCGLVR